MAGGRFVKLSFSHNARVAHDQIAFQADMVTGPRWFCGQLREGPRAMLLIFQRH